MKINSKSKKQLTISLITVLYLTMQTPFAALNVIAAKQSSITIYSEPKSSKKTGVLDVINIKELNNGSGLEIQKDASNGRFLQVIINGDVYWIKTKEVKTDQVFNVGICDSKNKITGSRGGINCEN